MWWLGCLWRRLSFRRFLWSLEVAATALVALEGTAFAISVGNCGTGRLDNAVAVLYSTESNKRRIAAYYVHPKGGIDSDRFQEVLLDANPRRLYATSRALYVATRNRIEALAIDRTTGCLSTFRDADGKLIRPSSFDRSNFQYLATDPDERQLYVAMSAVERILAYPIAADGSVQDFGSCAQGRRNTRYQGLVATSSHLYAAAHVPGRVDIFPLRMDGAIESLPDSFAALQVCIGGTEDTQKCDVASDCPGGSCQDPNSFLQVFTECDLQTPTFAPRQTGTINNAKALLFNDRARTLYIEDLATDRIFGCPVADDGDLPACPNVNKNEANSRTQKGGRPEQMALSDDDVLYNSIFLAGVMRAYRLKSNCLGGSNAGERCTVDAECPGGLCQDGRVPKKPKRTKPDNLAWSPVGMAVCYDALYVGQGINDTVQAFRIDENGFVGVKPFSRTRRIRGSFPNDVWVVELGTGEARPLPSRCTQ
jgi:sugar lactone lactonase YvrE